MATTQFQPHRHFKTKSREYLIASRLAQGKSREQTLRELARLVGTDHRLTFFENAPGRRGRPSGDSRPKPQKDQFKLFIWAVDKTIKEMVAEGWSNPESYTERKKWNSKERQYVRFRERFANELIKELNQTEPTPPPSIDPVDNGIPEPGSVEPDFPGKPEPEPLPPDEYDERGNLIRTFFHDDDGKVDFEVIEPPAPTRSDDIDFFHSIMLRARSFTLSRELAGEHLDFISTRAIKDGAKAIAHGVRVDEIVEAITKTWPRDTKNEFARWSEEWKPGKRTIDPVPYRHKANLPGAHAYLGYVMHLAEARIPIFLVGPSGCGKSFLARDLADALDVEYGEIPITAGATPSWLVGAETISGYKSRPFIEIYGNGGVFCLEEMDAADPNMLLLINNALANEAMFNPVTGQEITKHEDFIAIATANTWGLGSNRQFTGRERLDAATLDRWRVGRVEMDYDNDIEMNIITFWKEYADNLDKPKKAKPKKAART